MRRMGRLALLLLMVAALSGCDSIYSLFNPVPDSDPQVQWVSENPEMYFVWEPEKGCQGQLVVGDRTWSINVGFRSSNMYVLSRILKNGHEVDHTLFFGTRRFSDSQLTLWVEQDNDNIFGGDLPTIVFEKQARPEEDVPPTSTSSEAGGKGHLDAEIGK